MAKKVGCKPGQKKINNKCIKLRAIPSYHNPSTDEIKKRQKKSIPIGYNIRNDIARDKYHGFIKIGALLGEKRMDVIMDSGLVRRKYKYYLADYHTGRVLKRSNSMDEIWKGVK